MIVPKGVTVRRGRRTYKAGAELPDLEKGQELVKAAVDKSASFHKEGRDFEAKAKAPAEKIESVSPESKGDKK